MNYRIILIILVPFLISCGDDDDPLNGNCISGSGSTTSEIRTVDQFHSISASMVGDVFITQGTPQELRIVTHPLILEVLETEVINEELSIRFDDCIEELEILDIFITIPDIRSINFSGIGSVTSLNELNLEELTVSYSGVGETTLNGQVTNFQYSLSGIGDLKAFDLITSRSEIVISGIGNVEITALDELDVIISGNGNVSYKGDPNITSIVSGNGNVIDAN